MSRSTVVDQRYRLQAADLGNAVWRVVIRDVSWQGLEELTPVLHFEAAPLRHLALDAKQRQELIRSTRSALCSDWVGKRVELRAARSAGDATIAIASPLASEPFYRLPRLRSRRKIDWYAVLGLVLFLLAMLALLWLSRAADAPQLILDFL